MSAAPSYFFSDVFGEGGWLGRHNGRLFWYKHASGVHVEGVIHDSEPTCGFGDERGFCFLPPEHDGPHLGQSTTSLLSDGRLVARRIYRSDCGPDCTATTHRNPCLVAEAIAEGEAFERGD